MDYFIEFDLAESLKSTYEINTVDEVTTLKYIEETLEGCLFLKSNNIFHRDIKPGNILWRKGHIKLSDFGESKYVES